MNETEDTPEKTDNSQEKFVTLSPISLSNVVESQEIISSPEQDKNVEAAAEKQVRETSGGETSSSAHNLTRKSACGLEAEARAGAGARVFTSVAPGVSQVSAKPEDERSKKPVENSLRVKGSPSASKSPGYVRKPMPINEPKPVLPRSKQINVEEEEPAGRLANSRTEVRAKVVRKFSHNDQSQSQDNKSQKTKEEIKNRKMSSSSPLSPRLNSKLRPTTLTLDKREKIKRSSAVSATPSTDSSKSSKTFEFLDYDEETKEKILCDALKEEDEFLEFVATLDIEPPDPIIEAGKDAAKPGSEGLVTRGQDNLDSLCRMMEEIALLKYENSKLQERLHYVEVSSEPLTLQQCQTLTLVNTTLGHFQTVTLSNCQTAQCYIVSV